MFCLTSLVCLVRFVVGITCDVVWLLMFTIIVLLWILMNEFTRLFEFYLFVCWLG